MMTKTNTSTTKTLNLHGTPIKLDGSTVRLRDFNTRSNYSSIADFKDKNGTPKERSWNYITSSGKNHADENFHDIMLKSSTDGKKLVLWNRANFNERLEINTNEDGTISANDKTRIESTITAWEEEALRFSDRKFVAANSAIKGAKLSRPGEQPASASNDDTDNRFSVPISESASRFLDPKATKFATTFMGKTLIAGQATDVVTFPENPAYNISVTYDSETGYTVKAPIKGVTEGKTFKNAQKAQRAIAKYETAIKKHLEKTKKPEEAPNRFTTETNIPNLFNLKLEGLENTINP